MGVFVERHNPLIFWKQASLIMFCRETTQGIKQCLGGENMTGITRLFDAS